jgi:hypothetical protein
MNLRRLVLAAGLGASASSALAADLPPSAAPAPIFIVNNNTFSLSEQFTATDPGVPGKTAKTVINFTHFDVWGYGTNFFTIDVLKSDRHDPASPCGNFLAPQLGCEGATEIYGLFRSTIGFNQVFGTKAFSMGPLSNVSFEFGGDANTENTFLAPEKRDVVGGLEFTFDLPFKGFLNVSPLVYKEWNHNAFVTPAFAAPGIRSGITDFSPTWAVETNYSMDLGFFPDWLPLNFSGYSNFYGPKGTGVDGRVPGTPPTAVEFNSQQKLTLDVGKMIAGPTRSHVLDLWVAYRYWQNKFGLDHTKSVCVTAKGSCTESSFVSGVSVTF